jgi:hypothetical protein
MKQTILFIGRASLALLMMMLTATTVWAEQVTEEQARQQAQDFLTKLQPTNKVRRAQGTTPQIAATCQVSGLYVFNVDGGGFVIVSNDDRTIPVLGFSNTGSIDPDNMPDNMRAWLQGYADEIAWLQQNNITMAAGTRTSAPRRAGGHSTAAISPLLTTTWNQDAPYNNLCPFYEKNQKSVTGCVATAMAQVMNFHQWPKEATKAIPGYITEASIDLTEGLPATTFDWANMKDSYADDYTADEANAVATLMQYCGYSVQMDYGPSSNARADVVAEALKKYFDYDINTTEYVLRDSYSAEEWADMIYHEIANNRPVVYAGNELNNGAGHAFVCDGYKYENETDFFHINWGWGGSKDNYFVLSALDPYSPGISGSTSTKGFIEKQEAIIGIQPAPQGLIVDVTPSTVGLQLNSLTPSRNPIVGGQPVNITLNMTNNSSDDYHGKIYLGLKEGDNYELFVGENFSFAAGETKDIVLPFTFTTIGTYKLVLCLPNTTGTYSTDGVVHATLNVVVPDGLTVYDGTEKHEFVPANITSFDRLTKSQFVIPATDLTTMEGGTINSISFYTTSDNIPINTPSAVNVYVKEVSYTEINAFETKENSSVIYKGRLNIISTADGGLLTIPFNTPYTYNGDNLLIGIENTAKTEMNPIVFYGKNVSGASVTGIDRQKEEYITPTQQNFIPKTTFDYTAATGVVYHVPTSIAVSEVTAGTATLSWTAPKGEVTGYVYQYKKANEETWSTEATVTTTTATISGLTAATAYNFRVKALYGSNESRFTFTNFTTDFSDDMCSITLKLTDEAGDGWSGAAIQVVDVLTGTLLGTYANKDLDGKKGYETNTFNVPVPNDRDINFVWVKGRFDNECSFVIYDVNGKVIYRYIQDTNGYGPSAGVFNTYHVDCRYTPNPSDLTVTPAPTTATVTWTGVASSYDVHYAPFPATGMGAGWLQYDDGSKWGDTGKYPAAIWTWGVMYPAVKGNRLTKVSFYQNIDFSDENITISIYSGDNPPSGTPLRTVEVKPLDSAGFREVTFDTPVEITPKENIWIVLTATGTYLLSYCKNNESNNQWIYYDGIWQHLGDLGLENAGWMIRGYFESTTDPETINWTKDTSTSGSYSITGLTPETDYMIQVRGDYGSDGKSEWVTSLFTTPAADATAISLTTPDPKGEENIYTLDGVKLDKVSPRKGVYIQNGRKVVVK